MAYNQSEPSSQHNSSLKSDSNAEGTRRIVLHVYDDESKEFSSITTYHGMVRIYNSASWPSLIFWCLVVTSCLVLFMIHTGYLFSVYKAKTTFLISKEIRNNFPINIKPVVTFCERNSTEISYSNHKPLLCNEFFIQIKINNQIINCNNISFYFVSQFGSCFTLDSQLFSFSKKLSVTVARNFSTSLAFEVHDKEYPSNIFGNGIHVFRGAHVKTEIAVAVQHFLENREERSCRNGKVETLENCQQKCEKKFLIEKLQCLQNSDSAKNETVFNKCITEAFEKIRPCNCSISCKRLKYLAQKISISKLAPLFQNHSRITVTFKDKSIKIEEESEKFVTVDLLSFVAGSMGLFLGMSCITLLEVFMYLFKSVWGTMNNARYKTYLSKLLGENVGNFLHADPDMSRSHEEIVITQTENPDNPAPPITLRIKQSLTNRKLSIQIKRSGDAQMLILPGQQRFFAQPSHRGILPAFNNSFEASHAQNSFDYF